MLQQIPQPRVTRQLSQRAVFEGLLHRGPISRADLAKATGLSKQTISEVVDAFEQRGWARPVGRTSGNIGRTAVLYELCPEAGYVVGVDLGGTKVTAAIADMTCATLLEVTEPTDRRGGKAVLDQIARLAAKLARDVKAHPSRVLCAAIGTPGVVNKRTGAIDLAPNVPGFDELEVGGLLKDKLGGHVLIENDVNLALLGEIWQGRARDAAHVAFLAFGTGVGLGLAANGRLIRGENGAAGEIGYLPIGGDAFSSETRSHGALEYEIGAGGVLRRYRAAGGGAESVKEIFERLAAGEQLAAKIIDETARIAALAAAAVAALFDPQLIVVGGSIGGRQEFLDRLQAHAARCAPRPLDICASALQNRAGVVGALAVALNWLHEELFGLPDLPGELPLPAPKVLSGASR
ncbi:MAG TPA: ROK family transcriptional regulator [Stellaceae bacterium]|nr:ROK family transcriptional regulator [Stellaceae bacterium]